jgi:tetratricopeptide (TPR) repeat protein
MATVQEALEIGVRNHQAGRLNIAEQAYRQILAAEPNHPDALYLLGIIACQASRHEIAVEYIGRAIHRRPHVAVFHKTLGDAYYYLRRLPEAVASFGRALQLNPSCPDTHNSLGAALKDQGHLEEAVASCRRALNLKPDLAPAHCNLGGVLCELGHLDEAVASCRRALVLKPDLVEAHCNLGAVLKIQGRADEAIACYRRALELNPRFAGAHATLANALKDQGRLSEALAAYRRALELRPGFAAAHNGIGAVLEELGNLGGAEEAFRAALRHDPRYAFAHYKLAGLLGGRLSESEVAAMRGLLAEGASVVQESVLTGDKRMFLHFGLARVLDARGNYAEAAAHAGHANALQLDFARKGGREYDAAEHESYVDRMIAICTPEFYERLRDFGSQSELPVFVVGLPRSGTTLIEQILASHSRVFGAGELNLGGGTMTALAGQSLDREAVGRLASAHLEKLRGMDSAALRIVDKMPDNYLYLGLLAVLFRRARFIHCRRDLRDVAVSCWTTHFREILWANDEEQIASRFRQHLRIMEHWRKVLPSPMLELGYEETVADLEGAARKLVAWCGLEWEPSCLEFHKARRPVSTASAVQVRQPIYTSSVGRWKNYEQSLAPLLSVIPQSPPG